MADVLWNNKSTADEFVSQAWFYVLKEAQLRGWNGDVGEGRRTLARQMFFWNCGPSGCCCCNNCNLAARPSPFAPHIRVGRRDHALDVTDPDTLARIMRSMGLACGFPVGGEPWHLEASSASQLRSVALRFKATTKSFVEPLPRHMERAAKVLLASRKKAQQTKAGTRPHKRAVARRNRARRKVERYWNRATKASYRRILRRVLDDRDGVIQFGEKK